MKWGRVVSRGGFSFCCPHYSLHAVFTQSPPQAPVTADAVVTAGGNYMHMMNDLSFFFVLQMGYLRVSKAAFPFIFPQTNNVESILLQRSKLSSQEANAYLKKEKASECPLEQGFFLLFFFVSINVLIFCDFCRSHRSSRKHLNSGAT